MSSSLLKIASVLPLAALGAHWISWQSRVDRCLDHGGAFDYRSGECRTDIAVLPTSGYLAENAALVAVSIFVSGTMLLVAFRRREV